MFSILRKLLLLVLGIPFVMLGTRFLLDAGESALTHHFAASWKPHAATIASVEHFSSNDQALGNQTVARYHYEHGGRTYTGEYSCIGEECPQPDLHRSLQTAQDESRPVTILVNPESPEQSLLFRHLHLPLFLLKAGAGLFCFFTGAVAVIFGVYLLHGPGAKKKAQS